MLTLLDNDKINFVIDIHQKFGQNSTSGASLSLHRLAYKIAKKGHNVYIFCDPQYPHKNIHRIKSKLISNEGFMNSYSWELFNFPPNKTVCVYPQITRGNPLNMNHVCRWILYHTEIDIEKQYGENDVYFNYNNFKTYYEKGDRKLTIFDYNFDKLSNKNNGKRNGFCHIIHKHTPPSGTKIFEDIGSFNLTDWKESGGYDYLTEKLNEFEYFLTHDQNSFYTTAAALCGCKSIIIKDGNSYEFSPNAYSESDEYKDILTPSEYRLKNPIQMFGVAYGWDDISWANKTIDLVRDHIKGLEKMDNKTVDEFVKYWENKIWS